MKKNADEALEIAKTMKDKDGLAMFGEGVKWAEVPELDEIKIKLDGWLEKKYISKAFMYDILEAIPKAKAEKEKGAADFTVNDIELLKWRSMLVYRITRNAGKGLSKEERSAAQNDVRNSLFDWFEKYGGKIKIPVYRTLYEIRG